MKSDTYILLIDPFTRVYMNKTNSLKVLLIFILTITIVNCNYAFAKIENLKLNIEFGRVISFQLIRATKATLPTFLFLPGVNRSLLADDEALQEIAHLGYGVATMNFSTQPFSINQLDKQEKPVFLKPNFKIEDLSLEVSALSNELKRNFGVKNIIHVSISYSAIVSSIIQDAQLIIDTSPMTSSAAVNPDLETYRAYLKSGEIFNPIYGPAITRSLLDQSYYKKWSDQVDDISKQFNLSEERKSDMISGYTVMSRLSEGFVWDFKKSVTSPKRVFIFARNDSALLLKDQLTLFSKILSNSQEALAFVVNDSGHIIPTDQPSAYVNILKYLLTAESRKVSGIFEVQPGNETPKLYKGAEAQTYIKSILNTL